LRYVAETPPASAAAKPLITAGPFVDGRNIDYGEDWLGAIRGGYGNELKRLRTQKPMAVVVQEAFADALRARGVYAEPGQGRLELQGTILKLDCSEYFNLEAHVLFEIRVLAADTKKALFTKQFIADQTEGGFGAGIFASVETLRLLAERTLREAIDKALDDPSLRTAIQNA
jgi:hypothetical protein